MANMIHLLNLCMLFTADRVVVVIVVFESDNKLRKLSERAV